VRLLRASGVRVLATARSLEAERAVVEAGAEPLHAGIEALPEWERETADAEVLYHVGLPRLDPPLRRRGARRRAAAARQGAEALARIAAGRPVVAASSGLVYGDRAEPAVDDDRAVAGPALAAIPLAAEAALAATALRAVRLPWVYGPGGLARDLIVGLRTRRYRVVGPGGNRWSLLSADDAAAALVAAAGVPPGAYTAAEDEAPTQLEVVHAICAVPGHPRPDHAPPTLSAMLLGSAMSEALGASLWIRTGRLAEAGWRPRGAWRRDLVALAEGPLPMAAG
jgi:nucleoside-diphosphate-sugar epimerase